MGLDIWDVDSNVARIYEQYGFDVGDPPGTAAIAVAALGPRCIRYVPDLSSRARLARIESEWRIYLRADTPSSEQGYLIGHELGELLYREHQHEPDFEEACNRFGAALCAPRPAVVSALGSLGHRIARLAVAFACSQTLIELRIPEVTGEPRAVVSRGKVWVRGEPYAPFASESVIRAHAVKPGPGVRRRTIRDAAHRVVLSASENARVSA